jgi:hypothetical protein
MKIGRLLAIFLQYLPQTDWLLPNHKEDIEEGIAPTRNL